MKVVVEYLENEAFKAKLPTLLQSADKPDIFYSWGGGVMQAQIEAGYVQDYQRAEGRPRRRPSIAAALDAFTVDGKLYGVPIRLQRSRLLLQQGAVQEGRRRSGLDGRPGTASSRAVKKLKAAGITPIVMGGGEKWPMHFY